MGYKFWRKTSMSIYSNFFCNYEVVVATFSGVKNCLGLGLGKGECNVNVLVVTHVTKGNKHEIRE